MLLARGARQPASPLLCEGRGSGRGAGGGVVRTRVAIAVASVIEARANPGPLGESGGSAKRQAEPRTCAPDGAGFDHRLPGALRPGHRLRGDAGGRDTADSAPCCSLTTGLAGVPRREAVIGVRWLANS